jgi:hypothetical protein
MGRLNPKKATIPVVAFFCIESLRCIQSVFLAIKEKIEIKVITKDLLL